MKPLLLTALTLLVVPPVAFVRAAEPQTAQAPRLAVIIAVDQLRADYLTRFASYFGEGGFRRFTREGTAFSDNHYRFAVTKTAAGHATISTGVNPFVHGIVANEWLDRASWRVVASVEDAQTKLVGAEPLPPSPGGIIAARAGRSPRALQSPTVGDQLKLRFGNRSRVIGVANKDRSSILLAGKLADAAFWMHRGRMVTSDYYAETMPAWADTFNTERRVEAVFGETWDRLLPVDVYNTVQGPDDADGEASPHGLGKTFPHKIDGGRTELSNSFYEAYSQSPHSLYLIADFAIAALKAENLGRGPEPDMLCVSFSQLDTMGHSFGPDSHEVMDCMLHLDRALARLLDAIHAQVGLQNAVVVLSADHGVSPLPERVSEQSPELAAGRFFGQPIDEQVEATLTKKFGALPQGQYWAFRENFGYHLRKEALLHTGTSLDAAAEVIKAILLTVPSIHAVYTRAELMAAPEEGNSLIARSRRSYFPARGHDVVFVLRPYFVDHGTVGTNHGTPWTYDTHVPMLWLGRGVPQGRRTERVGVDDIASTLSALLGLPAPPEAIGRNLLP